MNFSYACSRSVNQGGFSTKLEPILSKIKELHHRGHSWAVCAKFAHTTFLTSSPSLKIFFRCLLITVRSFSKSSAIVFWVSQSVSFWKKTSTFTLPVSVWKMTKFSIFCKSFLFGIVDFDEPAKSPKTVSLLMKWEILNKRPL